MNGRKFYAIVDTIYHDGRPVLGAFFGRNGKIKELLDKLADLMNAADFEVEPERNKGAHTWDEFSFGFEEKRNKVETALNDGASVFMAEQSNLAEKEKKPESDDLWLKPGTKEYAAWLEEEFKAGGLL